MWIGHRKEIRKQTLQAFAVKLNSDEGLTLETSAFESLYGGQFPLSTQLIKPNYLVILPTDAARQFLQKLTPHFICPSVFYFCVYVLLPIRLPVSSRIIGFQVEHSFGIFSIFSDFLIVLSFFLFSSEDCVDKMSPYKCILLQTLKLCSASPGIQNYMIENCPKTCDFCGKSSISIFIDSF